MSQLFVLVRSSLADGFHLAGIQAHGADNIDIAMELVESWIKTGETGLIIIDDGLLNQFPEPLRQQLANCPSLPHISLPGGDPLGVEATRAYQISEMIRRAIGVRITFKERRAGEKTHAGEW